MPGQEGRRKALEAFPTPQALASAGKRKWEKFLHTERLARPQTYEKRMEIFAHAAGFVSGQALTRAKSRLALARARMLRVLQSQIDSYRAEIEKLFAQHPDHDLFGSLPGAGPKIAPRLLGEIGSDRSRFEIQPPCSVWREQLPSATSLERSTRSISGDTATSCSAKLCICGPT